MRALSLTIIIVFLATLLGGCIVRSHRHGHRHQKSARKSDCPPAYHWNGYKCVHNGRGHAKGHRK